MIFLTAESPLVIQYFLLAVERTWFLPQWPSCGWMWRRRRSDMCWSLDNIWGWLISTGIAALFSRPPTRRTPPSRTGSSLKMLLLHGTSGLPVDNAANSVENLSCWQKAMIAVSASLRSSSETFWFPSDVTNTCISRCTSTSGAPLALVFASWSSFLFLLSLNRIPFNLMIHATATLKSLPIREMVHQLRCGVSVKKCCIYIESSVHFWVICSDTDVYWKGSPDFLRLLQKFWSFCLCATWSVVGWIHGWRNASPLGNLRVVPDDGDPVCYKGLETPVFIFNVLQNWHAVSPKAGLL